MSKSYLETLPFELILEISSYDDGILSYDDEILSLIIISIDILSMLKRLYSHINVSSTFLENSFSLHNDDKESLIKEYNYIKKQSAKSLNNKINRANKLNDIEPSLFQHHYYYVNNMIKLYHILLKHRKIDNTIYQEIKIMNWYNFIISNSLTKELYPDLFEHFYIKYKNKSNIYEVIRNMDPFKIKNDIYTSEYFNGLDDETLAIYTKYFPNDINNIISNVLIDLIDVNYTKTFRYIMNNFNINDILDLVYKCIGKCKIEWLDIIQNSKSRYNYGISSENDWQLINKLKHNYKYNYDDFFIKDGFFLLEIKSKIANLIVYNKTWETVNKLDIFLSFLETQELRLIKLSQLNKYRVDWEYKRINDLIDKLLCDFYGLLITDEILDFLIQDGFKISNRQLNEIHRRMGKDVPNDPIENKLNDDEMFDDEIELSNDSLDDDIKMFDDSSEDTIESNEIKD